jgi:hypothetical protein
MVGWLVQWWFLGLVIGSNADLPKVADLDGIASEFGSVGDKHIGGNLMCRPDERVSLTEHQCAHRRYRCGTILVIENKKNGNRSWCEVVDRGPYGANVFTSAGVPVLTDKGKKAWYVKNRRDEDPPEDLCPIGGCVGRWRGILDMSPTVTKDLGHNGLGRVRVYKLSRVIRYIEYLKKKKDRYSI